jgi:hypothetical protein
VAGGNGSPVDDKQSAEAFPELPETIVAMGDVPGGLWVPSENIDPDCDGRVVLTEAASMTFQFTSHGQASIGADAATSWRYSCRIPTLVGRNCSHRRVFRVPRRRLSVSFQLHGNCFTKRPAQREHFRKAGLPKPFTNCDRPTNDDLIGEAKAKRFELACRLAFWPSRAGAAQRRAFSTDGSFVEIRPNLRLTR